MLVTRREAEPMLGYAPHSLKVVMRQQRGRWPEPVACRVRDRALLWQAEALREAAGHGTGRARRAGRLDGADPDGIVTCLSCGRRLRSLGPHLARVHQITAVEYRAEHRLPATLALMAPDVRGALSEARLAAMDDDPEIIERMRAATPPNAVLVRWSIEGRTATAGFPAVRAARAAVARKTLPRAQQARRDAVEQRAHAAGYPSMADAIEATRSMSQRGAAARIGVAAGTVSRWRRRTAAAAARRLTGEEPGAPTGERSS